MLFLAPTPPRHKPALSAQQKQIHWLANLVVVIVLMMLAAVFWYFNHSALIASAR